MLYNAMKYQLRPLCVPVVSLHAETVIVRIDSSLALEICRGKIGNGRNFLLVYRYWSLVMAGPALFNRSFERPKLKSNRACIDEM